MAAELGLTVPGFEAAAYDHPAACTATRLCSVCVVLMRGDLKKEKRQLGKLCEAAVSGCKDPMPRVCMQIGS